jgi:hypothetical protein
VGIPSEISISAIHRASTRISHVLGISQGALAVSDSKVHSRGVAGVLNLDSKTTLEIIPKFLESEATWMNDFFYMSIFSKFGQILTLDQVAALPHDGNFPELVGRVFVSMYDDRKRNPIRAYKSIVNTDWQLTGNFDARDLILRPNDQGFPQTKVLLTQQNEWNAFIKQATALLVGQNLTTSTKSRLLRIQEELALQPNAPATAKRLPSRHNRWQPLVDLAASILDGSSLGFDASGVQSSPGFILSSWQLWEDFLSLALQIQPTVNIRRQKGYFLGTRFVNSEKGRAISSFPDITILGSEERAPILVDLKYKGSAENADLAISQQDIYECLAFHKASGIEKVVLLYPDDNPPQDSLPGALRIFDKVQIGALSVHGCKVKVSSISRRGGIREFGNQLLESIFRID